MNLHVVAYPELETSDLEQIQVYRRQYNSLYNVIAPHFTIVFSVPDMPLEVFTEEIKNQSAGISAIRFCLRSSVINKDSFSENYDAFLVPDEGFGMIIRLHDRLYSGRLSKHHRFDIPYIPHISIANSFDSTTIKKLVDEWNLREFEIRGCIAVLDVINYENRVITTIEKIQLKG
jgi:hypothetical protein